MNFPLSAGLSLTIVSDTHGLHRDLDPLPGGDIMVHCGDFCSASRRWSEIQDFAAWLLDQPYRHKVLCYGNHEFAFEANPSKRNIFGDAIVLLNESVTIEGLVLWGSPVTPLYGGAFGLCSSADRAKHWCKAPPGIDILVTHGPPYGILDRAPGKQEHAGDTELLHAVQTISPRVHCFGHIHGAYGVLERDGTTYVNAALLGDDAHLGYPAIHLRVPRKLVG